MTVCGAQALLAACLYTGHGGRMVTVHAHVYLPFLVAASFLSGLIFFGFFAFWALLSSGFCFGDFVK